MKEVTTELKVGIFALIAISVLSFMTFKVGGLPAIWEKGYRLYVEFSDISGLDEKSRIKIAGVEAGIVEKIILKDGKAIVTLLVNPDIAVYRNAKASLRMAGLLGDRYLALTTGTPDEPVLKNGEVITDVIPVADIDMLSSQLSTAAEHLGNLASNINDIFREDERATIREAIHNLNDVAISIKEISRENKEPLHDVLVQLRDFTKALSDQGPQMINDMSSAARNFNDKSPALIDDLGKLASELRAIMEENRFAFKETMDNIRTTTKFTSNIASKLEKGEGTLGKLMKDDALYNSFYKVTDEAGKSLEVVNRLRTFMDFHAEYNTGEDELKGFFELTLKPNDDMYYVLGVVSDPRGSVEITKTTTNSGATVTKEEIDESEIEFTAQFVKRFEDYALRIGVIESTFGLGADYYFNSDTGRIKFDVWDFGADEADADNAHIRVGVDYNVFKRIFVSAGVDNLLNSNRRGIYVGGGLKFEDEDFKYLFGSAPDLSF